MINFKQLVAKYFDKTQDASEFSEMCELINSDRAYAKQFLEWSVLEFQIQEKLAWEESSDYMRADDNLTFDTQYWLGTLKDVDFEGSGSLVDITNELLQKEHSEQQKLRDKKAKSISGKLGDDRRTIVISKGLFMGAMAAMLCLVVIIASQFTNETQIDPNDGRQATNTPRLNVVVAELLDGIDMKWSVASNSFAAGDKLHTGLMTLDSGLANIKTSRGVIMTVQGPCAIEISEENKV